MGILWANHQAGGFPNVPIDASQAEFADAILGWLSHFSSAFIVEDKTRSFSAKRGPVGLIVVASDGEIIKPFAIAFEWATKRNLLRGVVGFFQFVKYSKDVTLCVVYGTQEEYKLLLRQRRYGHELWHNGYGIWSIVGRKEHPRR